MGRGEVGGRWWEGEGEIKQDSDGRMERGGMKN